MIVYTVADVAQQWHTTHKVIQALIEAGELRARRDGMITARVLEAYIRQQQRLTRVYLAKRRADMSAQQARREVWGTGGDHHGR